jgi:hypothetical protein
LKIFIVDGKATTKKPFVFSTKNGRKLCYQKEDDTFYQIQEV